MAIARRVDGSHTSPTAVTALSVTLGSTPANGDLILAMVGALTTSDPAAVPSGFALLDSQAAGSFMKAWLYYKVAASESGPYNFTIPSAVKCWLWVGAYSGVDNASPPAVAKANPAAASAIVTPSLVVPNLGWLLSAVCGRRTATGAASTFSTSDGLDSERLDFGSGAASGTDVDGAVYDSNRGLAGGGAAARTITSSVTENNIAAFSIALTAVGAPPASSVPTRWGIHL